jgi:hypothetical protein
MKILKNIIGKQALISIVLSVCNLLLVPTQAQVIITAGTTVRVLAGTVVTSSQNLSVQNGAGLTVEGSLILKRNLINLNTTTNLGQGTIEFSGTVPQSISGQNTIGSLVLNNALGLDMGGNTTINNVLNLQNGHIRLDVNNLTLGVLAIVSGSPSSSSMVIATGTGELRKSFSGTGSFTYPVGDNSGTPEYSPVTLAFSAGSFATGNYAGVKLTNTAYPGIIGNYLNRYWAVSQNGISVPVYDALFQYVTADITGSEPDLSCTQVLPAPAITYNAANTTLHQLTAIGLSSFGTFTGAQALIDKILNLSFHLEGLYAGNGLMNKARNSTGDQFGGNIADKVSIELHQGANYATVSYSNNNVDLATSGIASFTIPSVQNGSYYLTIKHRNSVTVTSKLPVSFAGNTINYSFDTPAKAFGNNLKQMGDGQYVVFGGDSNQDGVVNGLDITAIGNQCTMFGAGYIAEDINGDGVLDAMDLIVTDNNASIFVSAKLP